MNDVSLITVNFIVYSPEGLFSDQVFKKNTMLLPKTKVNKRGKNIYNTIEMLLLQNTILYLTREPTVLTTMCKFEIIVHTVPDGCYSTMERFLTSSTCSSTKGMFNSCVLLVARLDILVSGYMHKFNQNNLEMSTKNCDLQFKLLNLLRSFQTQSYT